MKNILIVSGVLLCSLMVDGSDLPSIPPKTSEGLVADIPAMRLGASGRLPSGYFGPSASFALQAGGAVWGQRSLGDRYDSDLRVAKEASLEDHKELSRERLALIKQNLPSGMVVFDVVGNGSCAYYALCVLQKILNNPQSIISVSLGDVQKGLENMSRLILNSVSDSRERSTAGGEPDGDSTIMILETALRMDARYRKYIKAGELDWVYLCNDLKNKIVMFDYPFFPFAREAWGLPQIECVNGANLKTLREIPPCGALIGVGGNHFVVALPEVTSNGITIKEVICEDRDNQLRGTTVGEPIKSIFSSQFMPASQGGSSDTAGESADAFPLPQPEDCDFEDVQLEEMLELQSKLHKDMVSFDLPEKGDGYCALLAIRFFHDFPMKSVIEISENRMNTYLGRLVTRLGKCLCVQRWEDIQFEGKFLLPACEILSLPRIPIVLSNDVAGLSKFYPDGALINCGDRFVVILPRRTAGGVEVREILCIDWYGGWWSCKPGMPADMAMMAPRQCRLVVDQDKVADDFYCDFLYDYVAYDGECAKLLELQKELPPNMILLDVPGFGRSGYFALLALQFSMAMSDNSEIYISEEQLRLCCSGIATQIRRALEARSQGFDTDDEIEVLEAVLMGDERYCNDPDEVQWEKFLNDVASGRVEMNDVILPFASRILGCGITVIDDDKSFLRGIPSCGALICRKPSVYDGLPIHRESHHYVLALPVQSGEGIELTCQEQNGRLWYSRAGRVACCYDEE